MDEKEMNARRAGFMTAVGFLLENVSPASREEILGILALPGNDMAAEIVNDVHIVAALDARLDPCPEGFHWVQASQCCVPD